ncbi:gamma carbonic anhydrase family protein [Ferrimicrobium acidiphilum]|uniref:gamma carbonic anhydrase family protein n=1 Tax=Ferrimicrobium acidiphilum TaxID=121039 RepID=UPI0023F3741B|nr:gamma carbonic anhydrase family protein [Ferrimicrobium acidiphilum]
MPIYSLGDQVPEIASTAFVHPDAVIIGSVVIGEQASVWPKAVLRGDYGRIEVGDRTSIQDGSVIHATAELPTVVGAECVVGHLVHLEGCIVEDHCLIGSASVVLHRVRVHEHALVGANAMVTNDTVVPSFAMALGVPATIFPDRVSKGAFAQAVALYVANGQRYRSELVRLA